MFARNLFLTNGIVAQKSELATDPEIRMPFLLGSHVSKIFEISIFHNDVDLKTKLFLDVSKLKLFGRRSKKLFQRIVGSYPSTSLIVTSMIK